MARLERRLGARALVIVPIAAAAVGTAVHRLGHFLHEGAHFNVAPSRVVNDRLTNAVVGVVVLTDVRAYRPIHFAHHRRLGQADDPERSYFELLDGRFVVRGLSGARVAFALRQRLTSHTPGGADEQLAEARERQTGDGQPSKLVPLGGAALHAAFVVGMIRRRRYATAAAWVVGVGCVYPLINSTRQLLEHRDESCRSGVIPDDVSPRAVTRMFTTGPLSPILGGAGFNRHLLHHWDAGVSYTRLRELEISLRETVAEPIMATRNSTYSGTFGRMWRVGRRRRHA